MDILHSLESKQDIDEDFSQLRLMSLNGIPKKGKSFQNIF